MLKEYGKEGTGRRGKEDYEEGGKVGRAGGRRRQKRKKNRDEEKNI